MTSTPRETPLLLTVVFEDGLFLGAFDDADAAQRLVVARNGRGHHAIETYARQSIRKGHAHYYGSQQVHHNIVADAKCQICGATVTETIESLERVGGKP